MNQPMLNFEGDDKVHLSPQQRRMVRLMKRQGGRATNVDFVVECHVLKYNNRLQELREKGFDIPEPVGGKNGVFTYTLAGGPEHD